MEVVSLHKEHEIVEKALKGNQLAMYQLYGQYARAMFNICYRIMNNKEEAEDMLQDSFTDVFRKLGTFRFESTLGAWIKKIVVNKCINTLRKRRIDMFLVEDITDFLPQKEEHKQDDEIDFEVEKIRKALYKLPDGYRIVFSLYSLEGYDHDEIGEILNISASTSKTQYMRAKNKIKELIKSEYNG